MRLRRAPLAVLAAALALACAAGEQRPGSRPGDAWVELTIRDRQVPADPVGAGDRPPPCEVELALDGRTLLATPLAPTGAAPPYTVDSRFLLAAAPGRHRAALHYSACRTDRDQLDGRDVEIEIEVRPGHVTRLEFDGAQVVAWPPVPGGAPAD